MNIRCPSCQTVFRVDPARIPPRGIRARCARCGDTFPVHRPADDAAAAASSTPVTPTAAPVATPPPTAQPSPPEPAPGAAAAAAAAASAPAQAPPTAGPPHTFGSRDPNARAQRIARALVSDIIAYHPKRWESAREAGTLRAEFRDEIMKSWEEYVAQVGLDLAKTTPHFRAALNDILARGQTVF